MFIEYDDDTTIGMIEGDFGIVLPINITLEEGETITPQDQFSMKIFDRKSENPLVEKTFNNITNNTMNFKLTKEESNLLKVGTYYYDIDWFQGENFLGNITAKAKFKVLDKAGA